MSDAKKSKFGRKREAAISALLSAVTLAEAAAQCGISEATLRRWRQEPEFEAEYRNAKGQLLETTINRLRIIGIDGVMALHRVAVDKDSPAGAVVSAGRAIAEVLLKAVEVQDMEERLRKLEASMAGDL